jgi:hypothetical protein
MDKPETQTTLGTRHRQHWTYDTDNTGHTTQTTLGIRHRQQWAYDTDNTGHAKQTTLGIRHRQHWAYDTDNAGHTTQTTLGIRHREHWARNRMRTNKAKHTTRKIKKMTNTDPTNKQGVNSDDSEGQAVPVSGKTPIVLFIVKTSKSLGGDKGKNKST